MKSACPGCFHECYLTFLLVPSIHFRASSLRSRRNENVCCPIVGRQSVQLRQGDLVRHPPKSSCLCPKPWTRPPAVVALSAGGRGFCPAGARLSVHAPQPVQKALARSFAFCTTKRARRVATTGSGVRFHEKVFSVKGELGGPRL